VRNKKPDTPQGADPEPKNLQTNQLPKAAPAARREWTIRGRDAVGSNGSDGGPCDCVAGVEPACEGIWGNEDLYIERNS